MYIVPAHLNPYQDYTFLKIILFNYTSKIWSCHLILAGVTGFEPAASGSQRNILFRLIYRRLRRFLLGFTSSLTILNPLFPRAPHPSVVIYVVKALPASKPGLISDSERETFFTSFALRYCTSAGAVIQVFLRDRYISFWWAVNKKTGQ